MSKAILSPTILRKSAAEVIVIPLSFRPKMSDKEVITNLTVSVSSPSGLTIAVLGWSGQNGQVTLTSGTAGIDYRFIGTATTNSGQTVQIECRVFVRVE